MIVFGCLLAVWGFSVHLRCSDATIRRYLVIIAALFIFWLLDVLLKYPAENDLLISFYWYLFYVPIIFAPTLFLFAALRAAALDRLPAIRFLKRVVVSVGCVLVVFVLTNNLHHEVFAFDFADPEWSGSYSLSWGYWLVFTWCVALFAAFTAVLFVAAQRQLRNAFAPLLMVVCAGLIYALLYALRIENTMVSNFALSYSFIVVVGLELCLDLGLLPSYVWYGEAFRKLPLDLRVLTRDCRTAFLTDCAKPLSPTVRDALENAVAAATGPFSFRTDEEPAILYKTYSIAGGTALLAEDVTGIVERRAQLKRRQNILLRRNLMIERSHAIQSRLYRQKIEQEIFDEVEQSLAVTTGRVRAILDSLPTGKDERSSTRRREQLILVKILIAYCKRKGSLVFAERDEPDFNRDRMQLIANETSADLQAAGIDCAAIVEVDSVLPAATVSVLYDCLYDFAIAAFSYDDPALMFYLHDCDPKHVEMNAVLEAREMDASSLLQSIGALREKLERRNVAFRLSDSGDRLSLTVVASKQAR